MRFRFKDSDDISVGDVLMFVLRGFTVEDERNAMDSLILYMLICVCLVFVGCASQHAVTEQAAASTELLRLEQQVQRLVNQYRISRHLPPLISHETISQQARKHSQAMANREVPLGHDRFERRERAISEVLSFSAAAENVAYIQGYSDTAQNAVNGWLRNTRHRENIEGDYTLTGIGVAIDRHGAYYFTQIFWQ